MVSSSGKTAQIPMKSIGPIQIVGPLLNEAILVPLATFETPLWPSTNRGALVSRQAGGIRVVVVENNMTRSIVLEAKTAVQAETLVSWLKTTTALLELEKEVKETSNFAELKAVHTQIVGKLIYIRFQFFTGDAAGHNMSTQASEALLNLLITKFPFLNYVSISGNYCTDKKVSAVNGILGRGKYVIAEMNISRSILVKTLKTIPEKIVQLNIKKNLIGSIVSGGLRSANAHFANMLLGFYLATGQDAANIIEGSQGITHAEVTEEGELYFSVTLPNVIVGSVGAGKDLPFVTENLKNLGCLENRDVGKNAERLAAIAAAIVFCGELSLMAAQTQPGELMQSHLRLERMKKSALKSNLKTKQDEAVLKDAVC